ncbi:MAG: hypothetical protein ACI87W_000222 [Halieaceae bacterium]|jgi:hypothetical protein
MQRIIHMNRFLPRLSQGLLLLWCLLALVPVAAAENSITDEWNGVASIVAVGDLHGDYDNYIEVLREAGIVDRRGQWIAGETHFVQLGDVPDRGADTARIIAHLQKLETQAQRAGGMVHALIGNHEAMNVSGDLRYVHPGEYGALKSSKARKLRNDYYQRVVAARESLPKPAPTNETFREAWFAEHPMGFVEHRQHWHPQGPFGAWVSEHNTVIKINNMLFMHAGLGPGYAHMSIQAINEKIRQEMKNPQPLVDQLSTAEDGPLWYRGLAREESAAEEAHLTSLLEHFQVDHIVLGHTPGFGTIMPRYGARVLLIDSGISAHYGGHRASLRVSEEREFFTVQAGEAVPIPQGSAALLPYFQRIAELEPDVNNLLYLINTLQAADTEESTVGEHAQ